MFPALCCVTTQSRFYLFRFYLWHNEQTSELRGLAGLYCTSISVIYLGPAPCRDLKNKLHFKIDAMWAVLFIVTLAAEV